MDNIYNVRSDSAKAVANLGIARINLKYNADENTFGDFPITMREVLKLANDNIIVITYNPIANVHVFDYVTVVGMNEGVWTVMTSDITFTAAKLDDYPTAQVI